MRATGHDRLLAMALLLASAAWGAPARREVFAMGTRLTLEVEAQSGEAALAATEAALKEVARLEAACSTWRDDTRFAALNAAAGAPVVVGPELAGLLARTLAWSSVTGGAFDPVLGRLIEAWGTRHGGRTPTAEEVREARAASGARWLRVDVARGTAQLLNPRAAVEEGGFLKGYALDRMALALRASGATSAVLDFGGQVLIFGQPTVTRVASPVDRARATFELELKAGSVSSSGTSEHGRHLLDPARGEPSPAWGSVTVVADDGLSADVLSTALYVMGPTEGPRWASAHQVAALFQPVEGPAQWTPAARRFSPHPVVSRSLP